MKINLSIVAILIFNIVLSQTVDLNRGLVAYYPLNGNANDFSSYQLTGTAYNVTVTQGHTPTRSAYNFNGYSSKILMGSNNRGIVDTLTISAWIKTSSNYGTQMIICKYDWRADHGFHLILSNGYVFLAGRDGSQTYYSTNRTTNYIADGQWHFVLGEIAGNTWTLYIDCSSISSITTPSINPSFINNEDLSFGFYPLGHNGDHQYFNGDIDEVRIYNRVLNSAEKTHLCKDYSATVIKDFSISTVTIYPNPGNHLLYFKNNTKIIAVKIYDITGKLVLSSSGYDLKSINIENLKTGSYLITLLSNKDIEPVRRIFIKE